MKHSRICAWWLSRGWWCATCACQRRRQQPGPALALEVMARIGKPCAPLLRIRPARAAHGLGRQVTTLDHKLAAKLAAPMTREIFIGSVTRATHVRRQDMMVALVTPCSAFSFRRLHTRRVFCRPRPQRLPNSTAKTDRLFLVHQRRLGPCVLRSQDLVGYFPHHQDGVLNRQRYEKSIASAGRINSGDR